MSQVQRFEIEWAGKPLIIETGRLAAQANGSCLVQYGDTVVLATAVMSRNLREGLDFFPLTVDFEEKLYAAGRIKGSRFVKREGRPTDEAVLTGRFIDRAIRPLFNKGMKNEVQIIVTCLAFDGENDPDVPGLIATSCALHMSDIPWNGPIADVRVGQVEGEWVLNPTYEARGKSLLDLAFAGTTEKVIMVEAGANEAPEETVLDAFWFGMKHMQKPLELIEQVRAAVGKPKLDMAALAGETAEKKAKREEVEGLSFGFVKEKMHELFFSQPKATKAERNAAKDLMKTLLKAHLLEKGIDDVDLHYGTAVVEDTIEMEVSRAILEEGKRVDGRPLTDVRPLEIEVAVLPRVHGSALFSRGETQVVSIVTLGAPGDEQTLDGMETVGKQRYMHHYNFPPFSVGEVKPLRGASRRDIGHGALAEKAVNRMIPEKEAFPYAIRVVSEVMGSNGSSSMASTCASTLALMDAGVKIKAPIAGVAIGLATNARGDWKILTDIQDLEDGAGGMDFKIAGSKTGVTAIQMDTKTRGLTPDMIKQAFAQGHEARLHILDQMLAVIPESRSDLSPYAPRIVSLRIDPERIGDVIGPGGKMINEIIDTTGVQTIDIEDDGLVMITSMDAEAAKKAEEWVKNLTREVVVGEIYRGKVTRLMDFGAFVEILPKKEGLVHISAIAPWRIDSVSDIVKIGDEVNVKVSEIDSMGRINLSMKDAPDNVYPEKPANAEPPEERRFGGRPGGRGFGRGGGGGRGGFGPRRGPRP